MTSDIPYPEWHSYRMLSAAGYRRILTELGLSGAAACRLLDISPSTGRRYAQGTATVPTAIALLLRLILENNIPIVVPLRERWGKGAK